MLGLLIIIILAFAFGIWWANKKNAGKNPIDEIVDNAKKTADKFTKKQ